MHFFSLAGLSCLLKDAGLREVVAVERSGYPWNFTVAWFVFYLYTAGRRSRFKDQPLIRIPASLLALLAVPITLLADVTIAPILNPFRGGILRVVARRTPG